MGATNVMTFAVLAVAVTTMWLCTSSVDAQGNPKPPSLPTSETFTLFEVLRRPRGQVVRKMNENDIPLDCCDASRLGFCAVDNEVAEGNVWVDFVNNKTRANYGEGIIINWYGTGLPNLNPKSFTVSPNGTCINWCGLAGLTPNYFNVPKNPKEHKYVGTKTVNGKVVHGWEYDVTLMGIIVMETITVWYDMEANPVVPVERVLVFEPFGKFAGDVTEHYNEIQYGVPSPEHFEVKNADTCPQANNCNSEELQEYRIRTRQYDDWMMHFMDANPRISLEEAVELLKQKAAKIYKGDAEPEKMPFQSFRDRDTTTLKFPPTILEHNGRTIEWTVV